jgi:hypothetical protein
MIRIRAVASVIELFNVYHHHHHNVTTGRVRFFYGPSVYIREVRRVKADVRISRRCLWDLIPWSDLYVDSPKVRVILFR